MAHMRFDPIVAKGDKSDTEPVDLKGSETCRMVRLSPITLSRYLDRVMEPPT